MRYFVGIILILLAGVVSGQTVLSKIPANGKSMLAFVPEGYDTLATVKGDLNNDRQEDIALVLKSLAESRDSMDDEGPSRILIILFKTASGFQSVAKTDSAILCFTCGGMYGDPFAMMEIKKNVLIINHYGGSAWRWELTHRFRFQQNDFYLIGETNYSYWNVKMCDKLKDFAGTNLKDVNYLTGQFVEKEITEECKLKVNKKGKRKVEPLKKLSDFNIEN
jgi:hypothetical protein